MEHPVSTTAQSKAWVCCHSPVEIVGSNPTGDVEVCLLLVLSGRSLCDELIPRPEDCGASLCVI